MTMTLRPTSIGRRRMRHGWCAVSLLIAAAALTGPAARPSAAAVAPALADEVIAIRTVPGVSGEWRFRSDGVVEVYNGALHVGDLTTRRVNVEPVDGLVAPDGSGYWIILANGRVLAFGGAVDYGQLDRHRLAAPVVGAALSPTGLGYVLLDGAGGRHPFGDALVTVAPPAPGAVGPVTFDRRDDRSVTLSWSAPTSGSSPTGYAVRVGEEILGITTLTAVSIPLAAVDGPVTVLARSDAGAGPWSTAVGEGDAGHEPPVLATAPAGEAFDLSAPDSRAFQIVRFDLFDPSGIDRTPLRVEWHNSDDPSAPVIDATVVPIDGDGWVTSWRSDIVWRRGHGGGLWVATAYVVDVAANPTSFVVGTADITAPPPDLDAPTFTLQTLTTTDTDVLPVLLEAVVEARDVSGVANLLLDLRYAGTTTRAGLASGSFPSPTGTVAGRWTITERGRYEVVLVTATDVVGNAIGPTVLARIDVQPPVSGYWMLDRDGYVYAFGAAGDAVPSGTIAPVTSPAVKILDHPSGRGAWVLERNGRVHALGAARDLGSVAADSLDPGELPSTMAATPDGLGYTVFTTKGRAITFGTATFHGDLVELGLADRLNGPIIDSAALPDGRGYFMVGSDGGIFAFGAARFAGSVPEVLPGVVLNQPVIGIVADPDGGGYWLVAADGGVFAFDADFVGSVPEVLAAGVSLNEPVNGLVPYGSGYLMVAADGGVFNFSDRAFAGSLGGIAIPSPIVGIAPA